MESLSPFIYTLTCRFSFVLCPGFRHEWQKGGDNWGALMVAGGPYIHKEQFHQSKQATMSQMENTESTTAPVPETGKRSLRACRPAVGFFREDAESADVLRQEADLLGDQLTTLDASIVVLEANLRVGKRRRREVLQRFKAVQNRLEAHDRQHMIAAPGILDWKDAPFANSVKVEVQLQLEVAKATAGNACDTIRLKSGTYIRVHAWSIESTVIKAPPAWAQELQLNNYVNHLVRQQMTDAFIVTSMKRKSDVFLVLEWENGDQGNAFVDTSFPMYVQVDPTDLSVYPDGTTQTPEAIRGMMFAANSQ